MGGGKISGDGSGGRSISGGGNDPVEFSTL